MSESLRGLSSACPLVISMWQSLGSQLLLAQPLHVLKGNNDPSLLLWESALGSAAERPAGIIKVKGGERTAASGCDM